MFCACSKAYVAFHGARHGIFLSVCFAGGCKSIFCSAFWKRLESILHFARDYLSFFFPVAEEKAWG